LEMNLSSSGGYKAGDVARHKEECTAAACMGRPAARIFAIRSARNMLPDRRNVRRENPPGALEPKMYPGGKESLVMTLVVREFVIVLQSQSHQIMRLVE
jgi:hypothetical protein